MLLTHCFHFGDFVGGLISLDFVDWEFAHEYTVYQQQTSPQAELKLENPAAYYTLLCSPFIFLPPTSKPCSDPAWW